LRADDTFQEFNTLGVKIIGKIPEKQVTDIIARDAEAILIQSTLRANHHYPTHE
jgi:hypothetical protein